MSIEHHSSRPSPYPWYLETNKGPLSPGSPEVRSFVEQRLIPEDVAVLGLTIRLVVKNRRKEPLQDVRVFEIFSNLAASMELNAEQKESIRSIVRELEQNADQYSGGNMTEASLTLLDSIPDMLGIVVSNAIPDHKIDKPRHDDDLFESTGDNELDALIARLKTSGRGITMVDILSEGRRGRFEYIDENEGSDAAPRKMAAYAIYRFRAEPLSNGDTALAA